MKITINGKAYDFTPGQTIYEVARDNGIYIPVLCHHDRLKPVGACRVCVVEVEKAKTLVASCAMPAEEGMVVLTDTERVRQSRKFTVELLLTQGHHKCVTCEASGNCILQDLAYSLGIEMPRFSESDRVREVEQANEMIIRIPITTGVSARETWSRKRRPMPGQAKMLSVTIAPPSRKGMSRPTMVTSGREAFLSACR